MAHPRYCGVQGGRWDFGRLVVGSDTIPGSSDGSLVYEFLVMVSNEMNCSVLSVR